GPGGWYWSFAWGSALRSFTASWAELRPPMPLAATPLVKGPMKPTLTWSFAAAGPPHEVASSMAAAMARVGVLMIPSEQADDRAMPPPGMPRHTGAFVPVRQIDRAGASAASE